jgi:hypothetical protein
VLGHYGFQDLLHHSLAEQNLLHQFSVYPTMISGHRHSLSIG